ncbi:MAG: hypothetical protein F6K00_29580 [Leptolyngbya sp. SIOISBB]|nr:hypothetical protein [Leptolyngbya sp. SIOISBB]
MKVFLTQLGHWPTWFWRLPFPALRLGLIIFLLPLSSIWPQYSRLRTLSGWRRFGIVAGVLLFIAITSHANPAMAQLFDTVEDQAQTLFGEYLDSGIIAFIFGVLRIVIWVSAVGFVFFAVYQAQRGEQWQPLLQNAFIIIAAVVIVEGLSRLFFGTV